MTDLNKHKHIMKGSTSKVSQVERFCFQKYVFWSGMTWSRTGFFSVRENTRVCLVSPDGTGILTRPTVSPKYKPLLDQTRPDIFPNSAKTYTIT